MLGVSRGWRLRTLARCRGVGVVKRVSEYIRWATPDWRVSAVVWAVVLLLYVWVPFEANSYDLFECADGYSNVPAVYVGTAVVVVLIAFYPLWRVVLHYANDGDRRRLVLVVGVGIMSCAAASLVAAYVVFGQEYPLDGRGGGVC